MCQQQKEKINNQILGVNPLSPTSNQHLISYIEVRRLKERVNKFIFIITQFSLYLVNYFKILKPNGPMHYSYNKNHFYPVFVIWRSWYNVYLQNVD